MLEINSRRNTAVAHPVALYGREPVTGMESFAAATLTLLGRVIAADWTFMHVVDEDYGCITVGSRGASGEFRAAYDDRQMRRIDPLAAVRGSRAQDGGLVSLKEAAECAPTPATAEYLAFLHSFAVVDVAEMIFTNSGAAIGGITLAWTRRTPGTLAEDWDVARSLQRYIQFNFRATWQGTPAGWRRRIATELNLTPREAQLVESLCAGQTNAELAHHLGISVATVKSHLLHIFSKLGVDNRAALVERALRAPSCPA